MGWRFTASSLVLARKNSSPKLFPSLLSERLEVLGILHTRITADIKATVRAGDATGSV